MAGETVADLLLVASRLWWYLGCVGVIGTSAFRLLVMPAISPIPAGVDRRAATVGAAAGAVLLTGTLARLYAQAYVSFGIDEPLTADLLLVTATALPPWSTGWMLQAAIAVGSVAAFGLARTGRTAAWATGHVMALAVVASAPLTGHAVSQPAFYILPLVLQALHVAGAGAWIGGLVVMMIVSLAREQPLDSSRLGRIVDAFTPVALGAAGLLFLSGAITTVLYLGQTSDLWTTGYGRTLLGKIVVASAGVGTAGFVNWQFVRPRLATPRGLKVLRRTMGVELLFALIVLALTARLVGLPQPGHG